MPAIPSNIPRLSGDGNNVRTGAVGQVIDGVGATRTLAATESGALCLFDRAAGIVYTLPPPVVGLEFEFMVTVTVTSNAAKVITDAATTFLIGGITVSNSGAATGKMFAGNGSTHIAVSQNGTTTGGVIGSKLKFKCISSTVWAVDGVVNGTGTEATPFSTT